MHTGDQKYDHLINAFRKKSHTEGKVDNLHSRYKFITLSKFFSVLRVGSKYLRKCRGCIFGFCFQSLHKYTQVNRHSSNRIHISIHKCVTCIFFTSYASWRFRKYKITFMGKTLRIDPVTYHFVFYALKSEIETHLQCRKIIIRKCILQLYYYICYALMTKWQI